MVDWVEGSEDDLDAGEDSFERDLGGENGDLQTDCAIRLSVLNPRLVRPQRSRESSSAGHGECRNNVHSEKAHGGNFP